MKKIIVYEGGQEHVLNAKKLRTPLQGGGTCDWLPEDEVQVGSTTVIENGTYRASQDDLYGYDQFTVAVSGGAGSADSSGKPSGTILPGGVGSAIVGEDEDGNDAVVGVDANGKMVKTPLPKSIEIVINPTKMEYVDGEAIDLSGAVVTAKNADGTTWTSADYPTGHVPLGELAIDPTTASGGTAQEYSLFDTTVYPAGSVVPYYQNVYSFTPELQGEHGNVYALPYLIDNNHVRILSFSSAGYQIMYRNGGMATGPAIIKTNGVFYGEIDGFGSSYPFQSTVPAAVSNAEGTSFKAALLSAGADFENEMVSGTTQEITLNWARPGDRKVISTTMEIRVTTSNSGEGSEGGE